MDLVERELLERAVPSALVKEDGKAVETAADMKAHREYLKKFLEENEYGLLPPIPDEMSVDSVPGVHAIISAKDFCAGKAISEDLTFNFRIGKHRFSFPARAAIPRGVSGKIPAFVHINFRSDEPDRYRPTEEIIDRGFAVFSFCYNDVTSDNDDFDDKCAKYLGRSRTKKNASGKIMMWAWAAMRVMDYIRTRPEIDADNVAVIGHSRLGKTALVTAAYDERFKYAISNDSGCSGAAISRGNLGESIEKITYKFPFWFCPRYKEEVRPEKKNFDQNFLTALIPPRHIIIGSAEEDLWAGPECEFLGCASANSVYQLYGMKGLIYGDAFPKAKTVLGEGDSCYQIRKGLHYLSREDWNVYMDFIEKKIKERSRGN